MYLKVIWNWKKIGEMEEGERGEYIDLVGIDYFHIFRILHISQFLYVAYIYNFIPTVTLLSSSPNILIFISQSKFNILIFISQSTLHLSAHGLFGIFFILPYFVKITFHFSHFWCPTSPFLKLLCVFISKLQWHHHITRWWWLKLQRDDETSPAKYILMLTKCYVLIYKGDSPL